MSDLTEDERAEVEHELRVLQDSIYSLQNLPAINADASGRRKEVLERMRADEQRMVRLLET